jgi:hypothetical protein
VPARPLARLAFGAGLLGLLAVSGCQRPLPEVTVTAGAKSVSAQPTRYCYAGQSAEKNNCRGTNQATNEIKVAATSAISIDVPPSVAKNGWYVVINNQRNQEPLHRHYIRVPLDASGLQKGRLDFQVFEAGRTQQDFKGAWAFTLVVG